MKVVTLVLTFIKGKILKFRKGKRVFWLLGIFSTMLLIFIIVLFSKDFSQGRSMEWGVTFSKKYAKALQLNWQKTYFDILYDLGADNIRIPVYWDEVEREEGVYSFEDYDWMISTADLAKVKIVLVLGRRLPRWPECFAPTWTKKMTDQQVQEKVLNLLKVEIEHFKKYDNIWAWQIENEPLLSVFGRCPPPDKKFLRKEIELIKSLDNRPVIITDSGELSSWFSTGKLADILGTTMYRVVWNRHVGYLYYPLPPAYYRYKADLIQKLNPKVKKVIVSELQVEPWAEGKTIPELSLERQFHSMSLERMKMNLRFAKATGFDRVYLWGVEWWYWLKTKHNRPEFWQLGKSLWVE